MTIDEKEQFLRGLDAEAFLTLGAPHVAYIREVDWLGSKHFAVYNADGSPLAISGDLDKALKAIQADDMQPVTLQ